MIGKKKYIIICVLIVALIILACVIKLVFSDNKEALSEEDDTVQEQILDFNQLEEETNEVKEGVHQETVDFSDTILDSEIDNDSDISDMDNKENEKDEENINHADKNAEDLNGNKDDNEHKENLQPVQDTSNEYGPIN